MNLSGRPVAALRELLQDPAGASAVLHDELDLPFGVVRLKLGGGDNGHNGLRSVTAALGGPGLPPDPDRHRPPARPDGPRRLRAAGLRSPPSAGRCRWLVDRAADASEALLRAGLAAAQNEFHRGI